jgi:hypothetical protein
MMLLTKEIKNLFTKTGRQENVKDPLIIAKFFYPAGYATWFATEFDPTERMFFGYCAVQQGGEEWGYFSLDEMQSFKGRFGLGIERDMHYRPKRVSECNEIGRYM